MAALPTLLALGWIMWVVVNDLAVMLADEREPRRNARWVPMGRRDSLLIGALLPAVAQAWFWFVLALA